MTVALVARQLSELGHRVDVFAPKGSQVEDFELVEVSGYHQVSQLIDRRQTVSMHYEAALAKMWERIRERHVDFDCILNFAYDWLPFYLSPFLSKPVKHLVSMAALNDGMREAVRSTALRFKDSIAMHSVAQAETFGLDGSCHIVGYGLDFDRYRYVDTPGDAFAWVGRISSEKGLEDAVAAAAQSGKRLRVFGKMENRSSWNSALAANPSAKIEHVGFLPTDQLQKELGKCSGLIATPKLIEALGVSFLEALAVGVPVIAYARGALAEYVKNGVNGYLVPADDVAAMAAAMGNVKAIERRACRASVESTFSLKEFGGRLEQWLKS